MDKIGERKNDLLPINHCSTLDSILYSDSLQSHLIIWEKEASMGFFVYLFVWWLFCWFFGVSIKRGLLVKVSKTRLVSSVFSQIEKSFIISNLKWSQDVRLSYEL